MGNVKYRFKSLNDSIATVNGNKVKGVSKGETKLEITDENEVNRGYVNVTVQDPTQAIEPVSISISPKSYSFDSYGIGTTHSTKLIATVSPENVTNCRVYWASGDETIVTVSGKMGVAESIGKGRTVRKDEGFKSTGTVKNLNKTGTTTVEASVVTSDGKKIAATCEVSVTASGVYITSVTPQQVPGVIPYTGGSQEFSVKKQVNGNDDGFIVLGAEYIDYKGGEGSGIGTDGFTALIQPNFGSYLKGTLVVRGLGGDDDGVTVSYEQEAAGPIMERLVNDSVTFEKAGGTNVNGSCRFKAALAEIITTGGNKTLDMTTIEEMISRCEITDTDGEIQDDGTVQKRGASVTWVKPIAGAAILTGLDGLDASQVNEYLNNMTVDGKEPSGAIAQYNLFLSCEGNESIAERTAYLYFPTLVNKKVYDPHTGKYIPSREWVESYCVLTVTQEG